MDETIQQFINEVNSYKQRYETEDFFMNQLYQIKKDSLSGNIKVGSPETMAFIRRVVEKTTGLFAYDTQVMAAINIYSGKIIEMKTGEGKTLAAAMAVCMHLLDGRKVHVLTANDYLVTRDYQWTAPIYEFLGFHSMAMTSETTESDRIESRRYDVVYSTNKEIAVNYSANRKANRSDKLIYNHFDVLIVDEADLLMIDESKKELSIGNELAPNPEPFKLAQNFVWTLEANDYRLGMDGAEFCLTDSGIKKAQDVFGFEDYFSNDNMAVRNAIRLSFVANHFFNRDINYIVKNNEVILVNTQTGRLMDAYKMLNGLQQAIECKEGLPMSMVKTNFTKIPYQFIYNQYKHKAGMTGTAITEAKEFKDIYNLDVIEIPTSKPIARIDLPDRIYITRAGRDAAVIEKIIEIHSTGQPVLVGTASIEHSETLARLLVEQNIAFNLLDAKHHENEAKIIQTAGWKNSVTIATNMAGRGTDIKVPKDSLELGGLFILGTERYSSRRADNQLRGRTGRQGDVGYSQFYISLEDDVISNLNVASIKGLMAFRKGFSSTDYIENQSILNLYNRAQIALEGKNYDERRKMLARNKNISEYYQNFFNRKLHLLRNNYSTEQILGMLIDSYKRDAKEYLRRFGRNLANDIDIENHQCNETVNLEEFYEMFNKGWVAFINRIETISINMYLDFSAKGDPELLLQKRISDNYSEMVLELKVMLIRMLQK